MLSPHTDTYTSVPFICTAAVEGRCHHCLQLKEEMTEQGRSNSVSQRCRAQAAPSHTSSHHGTECARMAPAVPRWEGVWLREDLLCASVPSSSGLATQLRLSEAPGKEALGSSCSGSKLQPSSWCPPTVGQPRGIWRSQGCPQSPVVTSVVPPLHVLVPPVEVF